MRDDRRGPRNRPAHGLLRSVAATALAVPIVGLIIGESLARRLASSRSALLSVGVLAVAIAISVLSTMPIGAPSSTPATPVADRESLAMPSPAPTIHATESNARSPGPSSSEPLQVAPTPEAPTIVRFRPRDGSVGVSRFAALSVRFSRSMEHASTEEAFHVAVGDTPITGTFGWAEGDTVLVLTPASPLPPGGAMALSVDVGARAADGVALAVARSVRFMVRKLPAPTARPSATVRPAASSSGWRWPLLGSITQQFGESLTQYGLHNGVDIDGKIGDPVRAARRGRVVVAGSYDQCGGLEVHIDHGDGLASWYRHLSRIDVAKGTLVEAGTVIGRVGDTGCSLGSHLHFAIRKGSTFVDPLDYLPPR